MLRPDLVSAIAEKTGLTKKDTEIFLDGFIYTVADTLRNEQNVKIVGFGQFLPKYNKARKGVDPRNGEEIDIDESITVKFKSGKDLLRFINRDESKKKRKSVLRVDD